MTPSLNPNPNLNPNSNFNPNFFLEGGGHAAAAGCRVLDLSEIFLPGEVRFITRTHDEDVGCAKLISHNYLLRKLDDDGPVTT